MSEKPTVWVYGNSIEVNLTEEVKVDKINAELVNIIEYYSDLDRAIEGINDMVENAKIMLKRVVEAIVEKWESIKRKVKEQIDAEVHAHLEDLLDMLFWLDKEFDNYKVFTSKIDDEDTGDEWYIIRLRNDNTAIEIHIQIREAGKSIIL